MKCKIGFLMALFCLTCPSVSHAQALTENIGMLGNSVEQAKGIQSLSGKIGGTLQLPDHAGDQKKPSQSGDDLTF